MDVWSRTALARLFWYYGTPPIEMAFRYRILVVDDDPSLLEISALVLKHKGYEVRTALDGFQALVELQEATPDVIISDLKMPNMSGFELLSIIRHRFPHVPVIAISGEFDGASPTDLIADGFFSKGHYTPEELFERIGDLIEKAPMRLSLGKPDKAPVWIPRNEAGYFVLTCTNCLRSFSVSDKKSWNAEGTREAQCIFCGSSNQFMPHTKT